MASVLWDAAAPRAWRATLGSHLGFQSDRLASQNRKEREHSQAEEMPTGNRAEKQGAWEAVSLVPRPIDGEVQAETVCLENESVQFASTTNHELLKNPALTNYQQLSEELQSREKNIIKYL